MKNVIFIAPPAAGKGTQSKILVNDGYIHISTGDMLREEINKKSEIGIKISEIMNKGLLVSDDIVDMLIKDKLNNLNSSFILDGYPRTINQAKSLDKLFEDLNITNYEVIYLDLSLDEALKRALGRLNCECGAFYNIYIDKLKPKKENICDKCGRTLIKRNDDNEESFTKRFETFLQNIEPIKEFYTNKNKLHIFDASLDSDLIAEKVKEILK